MARRRSKESNCIQQRDRRSRAVYCIQAHHEAHDRQIRGTLSVQSRVMSGETNECDYNHVSCESIVALLALHAAKPLPARIGAVDGTLRHSTRPDRRPKSEILCSERWVSPICCVSVFRSVRGARVLSSFPFRAQGNRSATLHAVLHALCMLCLLNTPYYKTYSSLTRSLVKRSRKGNKMYAVCGKHGMRG